jgi:hypothetical protein
MSPKVRNILIIVALAAAVALLPGGGAGAEVVGQLLFIAFAVGAAFLLVRLYRENRVAIFSLGERHRGLLYGAIATIVFCAAAAGRFLGSGPGILAWFALVGAASYALVVVWRHHREYG